MLPFLQYLFIQLFNWNFDRVRAELKASWNKKLERFEVKTNDHGKAMMKIQDRCQPGMFFLQWGFAL